MAELTINPQEITEALRKNLDGWEPGLEAATVGYVIAIGDGVARVEGLESAEGFLRRQLGRNLRLRRIPEMRFVADYTLEHARKIENLLDEALGDTRGDPQDDARDDDGSDEGL